jgi:hypothetical protein
MLRLNAKEGLNQKYYTYFHAPADVRGTAFLVWKYPDKDDDRWLFIPAIKLVTRIAAKDNQSSFVGSDFTYEDVSGRDLGADAYKLLREEAMAGRDCYVVESNPKAASAFSRKVSWIDKASFLPVKEEYYDVQDDLSRVFTADEVKEIKGHPTAVRRTMKNLKTGHYTSRLRGVDWRWTGGGSSPSGLSRHRPRSGSSRTRWESGVGLAPCGSPSSSAPRPRGR